MMCDDGNKVLRTTYSCRFCRTADKTKHYVSAEKGNHWAAAICEDCIDSCAAALAEMRSRVHSMKNAPGSTHTPPEDDGPSAA